TLQTRHQGLERSDKEVNITDAHMAQRGHHHVSIPTGALAILVSEVHRVCLDQTELDAIFGVTAVRAIATGVGGRVDTIGKRRTARQRYCGRDKCRSTPQRRRCCSAADKWKSAGYAGEPHELTT